MIGERQDESLAAPWTSVHAADGAHDVPIAGRPDPLLCGGDDAVARHRPLIRALWGRYHWALLGLLLALVAVAFAGFAVGRDSRVVTEEVGCLSAQGTIGCTLHDGWDVSVPLDVAWTDANGGFHEGGRPECLRQPAVAWKDPSVSPGRR